MNKDTVVGILGAVILVAAMVGIFYYEGTQAPGATGTGGGPGTGPGGSALYRTVNGTGPSLSGTATEGTPSEETLTINQTNLLAVEFVLTWADDIAGQDGPNDAFTITVTSPDGRSQDASGTDGEAGLTVRFSPLATLPTAAGVTSTNGTGTWTISIEVVAGDGAPVDVPPGVPPLPGVTDTGNSWSLATRTSSYQPA